MAMKPKSKVGVIDGVEVQLVNWFESVSPSPACSISRRSDMLLDECPICGGELQVTETREVYFSGATFMFDEGRISLDDIGCWRGDGDTDEATRFYCENDHTSDEMLDELTKEA